MLLLVAAGLGLLADDGSGAVGVAAATGVLKGEADTEDPDAVVGEAEAAGLGDAKGLGNGLGDRPTVFDAGGVTEALAPLSRDDDD